jgi:peptide deformylase
LACQKAHKIIDPSQPNATFAKILKMSGEPVVTNSVESVKIFQLGSEVIRQKAAAISFPLGDADSQLIETMIVAMRQKGLVGIAAPQVGQSKRVFVSEIRANRRGVAEDALRLFINPEIISYSDEKRVDYEGCGSVADANLFGEVERSLSVTIRYWDKIGTQTEERFEGLLARIVQHESDHLEGIVFTDKLYSTATLMSGSEYRRMIAERHEPALGEAIAAGVPNSEGFVLVEHGAQI